MAGILADLFASVTSLAQQCARVLRLKEFDTSTPQGRSLERYRRVALTAITTAGAKLVAVLTTLVTVPLTLHYLGTERYGMWMTISSIVAMIGFADLGMGLGLMNAISEAHGQDDRLAAERYVSSGFFMLSAVALLMVIGFGAAYPVVPWQRVFNVTSRQAVQEAGPALAVFVACFAVNLPLGIVRNVQQGYQEGFINSLWESAGRILGLMGLLLVIYVKAGLAWLVLALTGATAVALLLNSVELFGFRRPWLRPKLQNYRRTNARRVIHTGLFFFILQMGITFIYASDNLIITQFLGPEAVTQYAVPYQMFSFALVIFNAIISPLWPAYSEAIARGDLAWVRKTLNRSLKLILLLVGAVSIFFILFGRQILHLWVGSKITPSLFLNIGFGIWMILLTFGGSMTILLNAANIFRFQIIFISLTFIFSVAFKCLLIHYFSLPGIIWGTICAYILFYLIPYTIFINKKFYQDRAFDNVSP